MTDVSRLGLLVTLAFWREVAEAGLRQAFQVLLPFVVLVAASGSVDATALKAYGVAAVVAFLVVVLRRLVGAVPPDDSTVGVRVFYRAFSAFVGSLAGFLSASGFDLLSADYGAIFTAAAGAALTAVLHGYLDPAASDVRRYALAA